MFKDVSGEQLLEALGIPKDGVPRPRGVGVQDGKIIIHTRTGGGNREYYDSESICRANYPEYFKGGSNYEEQLKSFQNGEKYQFDDFSPIPEPEEPKGPWNDDLRANQYYISDEDDDFDSTYANFWFKIPQHLLDQVKE